MSCMGVGVGVGVGMLARLGSATLGLARGFNHVLHLSCGGLDMSLFHFPSAYRYQSVSSFHSRVHRSLEKS